MNKSIYLSWLCGWLSLSASALAQTEAVLDTDLKFVAGKTSLWSPLFQASWDKMNSLHDGKPERVEPPNKLIEKLNSYPWDEETVFPSKSRLVFAGLATKEFHAEAAKKIKALTGLTIPPLQNPSSEANLIYGALTRDIEFKSQFFRSKKKPLNFTDGSGKTLQCAFFGAIGKVSEQYGKNVRILHHDKAQKSFLLSISSEQEGDNLIIFRDPEVSSFAEAIKNIRGHRQAATPSYLREGDVIKIPYLKIKSETSFTSLLQGKRFYQGETIPWIVSSAFQLTEFELFEKGARIRVATGLGEEPFGSPPPKPVPRHFICDGPFMVLAWQDESDLPYLAVRVDSPEVLTPFEKP